MNLTNARVLVLGGSGALGGAVAAELDLRGVRVALAGRDPVKLKEASESLSRPAPCIEFDLREPGQSSHVVDAAVRHLGRLDGLINAAGVVAFGPLALLDDATLDEIIATDLTGPLQVVRAALPHLAGGFVVNVTGVVADTPIANMAAYSAAKAGLSAATQALAREARRDRIQVLDARPPHTDTGLAERAISGTAPDLPKGLDPSHVARVIVDGIESGRKQLPASAFGPATR